MNYQFRFNYIENLSGFFCFRGGSQNRLYKLRFLQNFLRILVSTMNNKVSTFNLVGQNIRLKSLHGREGRSCPQQGYFKALFSATDEITAPSINMAHLSPILINRGISILLIVVRKFGI